MGDERRVVVRQESSVALDEVQQVGHLFQIGRHVRVIADEVRVVELHVNYVLHLAAGRVERTHRRTGHDRGHGKKQW